MADQGYPRVTELRPSVWAIEVAPEATVYLRRNLAGVYQLDFTAPGVEVLSKHTETTRRH
jgi:hypothetical protein